MGRTRAKIGGGGGGSPTVWTGGEAKRSRKIFKSATVDASVRTVGMRPIGRGVSAARVRSRRRAATMARTRFAMDRRDRQRKKAMCRGAQNRPRAHRIWPTMARTRWQLDETISWLVANFQRRALLPARGLHVGQTEVGTFRHFPVVRRCNRGQAVFLTCDCRPVSRLRGCCVAGYK
jgi:hypothetical protein